MSQTQVVHSDDIQQLLTVIAEMEAIFNGSDDWAAKYAIIFGIHKNKIRPLLEKHGIRFTWVDYDTSYEEDVTQYMNAVLGDLRSTLQEMMASAVKPVNEMTDDELARDIISRIDAAFSDGSISLIPHRNDGADDITCPFCGQWTFVSGYASAEPLENGQHKPDCKGMQLKEAIEAWRARQDNS
jgi:hypothetical protein